VKHHHLEVLHLDEELFLLRQTMDIASRHRHTLLASLREAHWNMDRVCIEGHPCRGVW
jgi:hypothetical protein